MNTSRTDFSMPAGHNFNITLPWLIGLIEGEGCFLITHRPSKIYQGNQFQPMFTLSLINYQLPL